MSIDSGILELLKSWPQTTEFSGDNGWAFSSPVKLGRLPVSYLGSGRCFNGREPRRALANALALDPADPNADLALATAYNSVSRLQKAEAAAGMQSFDRLVTLF
jgi:hypothetical protein